MNKENNKSNLILKTKINDKNILVTGGGGFIRSNLCEALINNGNNVVCLDNFSTGKRKNLEKIIDHNNFNLIEGDIRIIKDCFESYQRY